MQALVDRASYYRLKAVQLREFAESEPYSRFRDRLGDLARRYDELADQLNRGEGENS